MLLKSLYDYYDILARDNKSNIPLEGYSSAQISYLIEISEDGEWEINTRKKRIEINTKKGKTSEKFVPVSEIVPEQLKRSGTHAPAYFLCDNSKYVFGISKEKNTPPKLFKQQFESFKNLHFEILKDVDDEGVKAVLNFLENWNVEKAEEILAEKYSGNIEDFLQGANFVFRLEDNDEFIHEREKIREAWFKYKNNNVKSKIGQCLITGQETQIAKLHGNIKNIKGANSTGAAIVSFNIPSFISYDKEQSYNAPVGIESAFKYTTALNYILRNDSPQKTYLGNITIGYWAKFTELIENEQEHYEIIKTGLNPPKQAEGSEKKFKQFWEDLLDGKRIAEIQDNIKENVQFYILGLSPNNARVSIRFFYHNLTFGNFIYRLAEHYEDMKLKGRKFDSIPIWKILDEIIPKNSKNKNHNDLLNGKVLHSIITGEKYPENFLTTVLTRIKHEQDDKEKYIYSITPERVAIIKGYLIRKARKDNNEELKEVLTVSLNEDTKNTAYRLGRLFAMLERIQIANAKKDNPKKELNSTIKDRFFSSASSSPKTVFPNLLNLAQNHLSQLGKKNKGKGLEIYFQKQLGEIIQGIEAVRSETDMGFPVTMDMQEQGLFVLGYYQQRFSKKNDEKEAEAEKQELEVLEPANV